MLKNVRNYVLLWVSICVSCVKRDGSTRATFFRRCTPIAITAGSPRGQQTPDVLANAAVPNQHWYEVRGSGAPVRPFFCYRGHGQRLFCRPECSLETVIPRKGTRCQQRFASFFCARGTVQQCALQVHKHVQSPCAPCWKPFSHLTSRWPQKHVQYLCAPSDHPFLRSRGLRLKLRRPNASFLCSQLVLH